MSSKKPRIGTNNVSETYKKMTQIEHILALPDTYIGSVEMSEIDLWVYDIETKTMIRKKINIVPGFYKIFDEIIVNAYDQHARVKEDKHAKPVKEIHVDINPETNEISVYNDGEGIDIEIHPEHNIYVPSLIFGELLTSANYDKKNKTTGGKNGYGAKLTNIYSKKFTIETVDTSRNRYFKQVFENNMSIKHKPIIEEKYTKKAFTKITFEPDLDRFNMKTIDNDILSLLYKRVYDMTACTDKNVTVYLNKHKLEYKAFEKYVNLYIGEKSATKRVYDELSDRWEIVACLSPDDKFEHVSFVNGIYTYKGGKHVEHLSQIISTKLAKHVEKKNTKKKINLKPSLIKDNLWIFVRSIIEDPSFESQTKDYLTTPPPKFGSKFTINDKFIEKLSKIGIVEKAIALSEYKDNFSLKKSDGKKRQMLKGIPKLDDANWAGGLKSTQCTLILTEGDSAKTFAISGLSVIGRDKYGVFPLKGKPLNVRDASDNQIANNDEINNIKKIIGLQQGKIYDDLLDLRYGSIMILTDADVDGSHIKGLLINMFHNFWPSLLKYDGFIKSMITPIVKARKKSDIKIFYTMSEYETWKTENNTDGYEIKYYKGLGTSTSGEAKEYFKDLDINEIQYIWNEDNIVNTTVNLAFSKSKSDDRKAWLENYDKDNIIEQKQKIIPVEDFINKELIHFSKYDCERSVPSLVDGLKPSQRKVIYSVLLRNLRRGIKVGQLSAYVAEKSSYHHGENSLNGTIISLAHNFVGSNNIHLLTPEGQFGTRLLGGKDHASPRYIFTKMEDILPCIFNSSDNTILNYLEDDGDTIEPEWYVPVIPMILVNGTDGIGTGFSSKIPCYNPLDIIENLKRKMRGDELIELIPWYRGFRGKIIKENEKYISKGMYRLLNDSEIEIYELPVGRWTDDYKEFLDSLIIEKGERKKNKNHILLDYQSQYTESSVRFILQFDKSQLTKLFNSGNFEKFMKLTDSKRTCITNMHLFNKDGQIRKYSSPNEILEEFYDVRKEFYIKRKEYLINKTQRELDVINARVVFIQGIIDDDIILKNKEDDEVIEILENAQLPKFTKGKLEYDPKAENENPSYDYLTYMPIKSITKRKIEELKKQLDDKTMELDVLKNRTINEFWTMDLDKIYDIYVKSLESYDKEQDKSEECTGRKKRKIPVRKGSQTKKNVKKI
jgi:DNA topoisomerase II